MKIKQYFARITGSLLIVQSDHENGPALFTLDIRVRSQFYIKDDSLFVRQSFTNDTLIFKSTGEELEVHYLLNTLNNTLEKHDRKRKTIKTLISLAAVAALAITVTYGSPHFFGSKIAPKTAETQPIKVEATPTVQNAPAKSEVSKSRPPVASLVQQKTTQDALDTLANNLRNATERQIFTVSLTSGHPRTLYVFSDPLCPHCREIEPALEAIGQRYNIVIFPVTLLGKQKTAAQVIPVLCAAPESRSKHWKNLFDDAAGMLEITGKEPVLTRCDIGEKALVVNDNAFSSYGFRGTPQLVADDGRPVPFSALQNDDTLDSFMNAGK
ncbi:thioredoxin fold domain-containing protein [Yersinia similis]|uniref:thioredoxin fold domain-containing protein n=1 Tax=Yersinia similis TaxID=367190 RepID=UPI00061C2421|nr:thioredoxin fold domain-containing protein [Yersinia similis]CNB82328.1 Protein-disulfide isomerase [Yersinia similis]